MVMHLRLRIDLDGIEPRIWRRVVVPVDLTLNELHGVIQIAMGWQECHLHDFQIGRKRYALPDPEDWDDRAEDEETTRLGDVVKPRSKLVYQYDFGDSWIHTVRVESLLPNGSGVPTCVDGARACPPEDSGGADGYLEMLAVLGDVEREEYRSIREWLPENFDPDRFDRARVDAELGRAFRRRAKRTPKAIKATEATKRREGARRTT